MGRPASLIELVTPRKHASEGSVGKRRPHPRSTSYTPNIKTMDKNKGEERARRKLTDSKGGCGRLAPSVLSSCFSVEGIRIKEKSSRKAHTAALKKN